MASVPRAVGSQPATGTTTTPPVMTNSLTTTTTQATMAPFTPKHRVPKAKRKRKGWGPYESITKERSVAFNLTLDIQNLRQEIQQLMTARELLQSRSLQLRHSPTGSLMQIVHEFMRLFRQGFPVQQLHSQRLVDTSGGRRDFLNSVIDPEIDFGSGNRGVEFMVEQIRRYSLFTRFIAMEMASFEIVLLDDDVVLIKVTGSWRFQILRETILGMFPHVAGNEGLLSRLVGREVCSPTTILFRFTKNDLICQYQPDANFVASFSEVLTDPDELADLLGQARIGEHSTIGVAKDGSLENLEEELVQSSQDARRRSPPRISHTRPVRQNEPDPEFELPVSRSQYPANHETRMSASRTQPPPAAFLDFYVDVVLRYIEAFARGWPTQSETASRDAWETPQSQFLRRYVSPRVIYGHNCGHNAIEQKWRAFSDSFQVMGVHATASPEVWQDRGSVFVRTQLVYCLRIDGYTIQSVFPHTRQHPSLVNALFGATVECPSLLEFEWANANADDASLISRMREQWYWDEALTSLLPLASDREFVLRHALLSPEGDVIQPSAQSPRPEPHVQTSLPSLSPQLNVRNVIL